MIVEKLHNKRIFEKGITIRSKYKVEDKILERNTDKSKQNDNIQNGICLEKYYYQNNVPIGKISEFDPRIKYTYILSNNGKNKFTCLNCGNTTTESEAGDGCPYCGTSYNIEFLDKALGSKYHYDRVIKQSNYRAITLVIDIIISAIIVTIYILKTCRTFNVYDISKIVLGTVILSLILYYVFYMVDAVAIMLPIKIYKDNLNKKQMKFWERMKKFNINKNTFFNNINYELQNYYYGEQSNKNIIDYDVIDYISFKENIVSNQKILVKVNMQIREIEFVDNNIKENIVKKEFTFEKNSEPILNLKAGENIIKCHNCGASIDVTKNKCEYCGTRINSYQEWYMI